MTCSTTRAPGAADEVVARMRAIAAESDPRDGVACFNAMCLRVTEPVARGIADGAFADPGFVEHLEVALAGLYFEAVDAAGSGAAVALPWQPLFTSRGNRTVWPVQFALAGMNAHVNHDLPLAIVRACRERGTAPNAEPVHADHLRVNDLLAEVEGEVRAEFAAEVARVASADAEQLEHFLSGFTATRARDLSWRNARVLWGRHHLEPLHRTNLAAIAVDVAAVSTALLTPIVPPPARPGLATGLS